ncbi:MAG: hypothetical protein U0353_03430 [Sandaracinus sp.]
MPHRAERLTRHFAPSDMTTTYAIDRKKQKKALSQPLEAEG